MTFRKILKAFSAFLLIMAIAFHSGGQENVQKSLPLIWTLSECIAYAKQNNISINELKLTAGLSEQGLMLSKNSRYPDLKFNAETGLSNGKSVVSSTNNYSLNSAITLYNGNYLRNDVKEKELTLQSAKLDVATSENDISLQITQAYLDILLSDENIKYISDLIMTSEAQVQQAEEKYKTGSIATKDLLQMQASLMNDKYSMVMAENTKRQNILSLKQIIQLPNEVKFEVEIPDSMNIPALLPPLSNVEQNALKTMPQIQSSMFALNIQDLEIKKARAGFKPVINLSGSLSSGYNYTNKNFGGLSSDSYFNGLDDNFNQQLGISLSMPILDRKSARINLNKSKIQRDFSELSLKREMTDLSQTVERAYINVVNAQGQLAAAAEQLKYNKELYRIANEQIRIGVYNNVEYMQQKIQYIQAVQSYTQAKYSSILYQKIYNFYNGVSLTQ